MADVMVDSLAWIDYFRAEGVETIPASDGLIAALCIRHRLQLLALDAHFDYLPEVRRLTVA